MNTARNALGGTGPGTAALAIAGQNGSNVLQTLTEKYNGSTWTEVADLNVARDQGSSAGESTSALYVGGFINPSYTHADLNERYNGTSWAEAADLNAARPYLRGFGSYTSAIACGGGAPPAPTAATEKWNGTSWSEVADLNQARRSFGTSGTDNEDGLAFGGNTP